MLDEGSSCLDSASWNDQIRRRLATEGQLIVITSLFELNDGSGPRASPRPQHIPFPYSLSKGMFDWWIKRG